MTLKVIYQSDASYGDLLQLSNSVSLHQQHLPFLLTEIYKNAGGLNSQLCCHTSNAERFRITYNRVQYFSFHPQGLTFMALTLYIFLGP